MKLKIILVLVVFALSLAYVLWRLWCVTPGGWPWKLAVTGVFVLWFGVAIAGFALTEHFSVKMATQLYEVGLPWLIAFLYLLLICVVTDVAVLCHVFPKALLYNSAFGLASTVGIVAAIMIAGNIHYRQKYREELAIKTEKPLEKPLTIVLASDLHVGYHNRRQDLARWVDIINAEHPDLVLIGGDILDRSVRPLLEGDFAAEFRRIEAPVWATLGNHEYYSDVDGAAKFFSDAGICLLRDEVRLFRGVEVIGRDDRTNSRRKPLSALTGSLGGFTILLDHQPYHLEEAEAAGIDFQFSGHTHRGQVWPISWATDAVYEKSWGHYTRGHTHYYVSSGLGIWGPKVRIGTRSEYLVLHIKN